MYVSVFGSSEIDAVALKRGLRGADRGRLGVGVDDPRKGLVVGFSRLAEDVRRDDLALVLAGVGQRPDTGDVADRPQPLAGAHVRVDGDPVGVGLDADGLEADPLDARAPAGGHQQVVTAQLRVPELEHEFLALSTRRARRRAEGELDAVAAQVLAQRLTERRRLARKDMLAALDQRHLAAETAHGLGQLDPDRTAAEHQQPPRDGLHAGRLAVGPDAIQLAQAGDRRDERIGAVGEHDVLGGVARPVDLDHARPGEPAAAAQEVDAVVGKPALLARVGVVRDHEVAPGERRLNIDLGRRHGLARAVDRLAWAQQGLRRDAGVVRALAADELALDQGDAKAALGQRAGAVLTRRASAEDDHVVVASAHRCLHRWSVAERVARRAPARARVIPGHVPGHQGTDQGLHGRDELMRARR